MTLGFQEDTMATAAAQAPAETDGHDHAAHGYITEKDAYLKRLKRIEGQARGLQRMVEEDKYCIDILTQVSAMTKALQAVAMGLREDQRGHRRGLTARPLLSTGSAKPFLAVHSRVLVGNLGEAAQAETVMTETVSAILRDRRVLATVAALAILAVAAALVPRPSIIVVREWAESMGPSFVVVFFLTQAVLTIAPVPRTVFTLSAGLLFGPATGVAVTIAATTVSAVLALLLVRALGRTAVQERLTNPAVKSIDARLARRGWLAVGSLRLIAPAPFALVNYCSGLSAVRLLPYTTATVVGILPGTIAAVLFGDALTGRTNPALIVVTSACVAAGVAGLLADARLPVSQAQPNTADGASRSGRLRRLLLPDRG